MKEILEAAQLKAKDAEVFSIKMEKYPISFAGNKLKSIKSQLAKNISLRVNVDGKIGFSSDTDTSDPHSFVQRAVDSAAFGPDCFYSFVKTEELSQVQLFDPKTVSFEMEDGVEIGQEIINKILKAAPDTFTDVKLSKNFYEITYMSGDIEKTYYKTLFTYLISNVQIKEDGFINIDEYNAFCKIPDNIMEAAELLIEKIGMAKYSTEMPSKPMTVIFHPKAMNNLLRPLTVGLSGDSLVSGSSPLLNKLNEKVLNDNFSLTDDALFDFASESAAFDGEGMPRKTLKLFDKGILANYLLDMHSAYKLEMEPNGCADRGIDSPPVASSSNLIISSGKTNLDDMISDIKEGLLVEEVIGGGQSNILAGEFSLNVSLGFRIKNGKLTQRVRNTMIAGNAYELLGEKLLAVGDKLYQIDSITAPYLMFKDLSVSGKEK